MFLMRSIAAPRVARAACSCARTRRGARASAPAVPIDFNSSRRFIRLPPPLFARSQMSLDYVRIQLRAKARFVADCDESILNIRSVELKNLIFPPTHAGNGFTGNVVADGSSPLAIVPGVQLATGVVRCQGQGEGIGHIRNAFRLQESATVT